VHVARLVQIGLAQLLQFVLCLEFGTGGAAFENPVVLLGVYKKRLLFDFVLATRAGGEGRENGRTYANVPEAGTVRRLHVVPVQLHE